MSRYVYLVFSAVEEVYGSSNNYILSQSLSKTEALRVCIEMAKQEGSIDSPQNKVIKLHIPEAVYLELRKKWANGAYCSAKDVRVFHETNAMYKEAALKLMSPAAAGESKKDESKEDESAKNRQAKF
jgi:hypothetical protein